ncbi:MAG: hypothetical protein PSN37_00395 [Alphaproteobacteria bacterium]|nr:hypothetical protein [Alphaproteobacteria bacterium]
MGCRCGNYFAGPFLDDVQFSPLANKVIFEKMQSFIRKGIDESGSLSY